MMTLLKQPDAPFTEAPGCGPGRNETVQRFIKNGKVYTMVWRDKITIEDPYLVLVKTSAYGVRTNEPYGGRTPRRAYRDYLIKSSLVI
jgi:hypothetical protein